MLQVYVYLKKIIANGFYMSIWKLSEVGHK